VERLRDCGTFRGVSSSKLYELAASPNRRSSILFSKFSTSILNYRLPVRCHVSHDTELRKVNSIASHSGQFFHFSARPRATKERFHAPTLLKFGFAATVFAGDYDF
jgi:hypothetical protein